MGGYRIAIALWDGVEELDFAGPYEVLTAWSRGASARSRSARSPSHATRLPALTA
jgi:putative intracellular protease/amidase